MICLQPVALSRRPLKPIRQLGGEVTDAVAFVINLPEIGGEEKLKALGLNVYSICEFAGH